MSIRSINETNTQGYGVFGDIFTLRSPEFPTPSAVRLDLRTALADMPTNPFLTNPAVRIIRLKWNFSVDILEADLSAIKQYDNRSGKMQFGNWTSSVYDYTTADGFISYDRLLSPPFTCSFLLVGDSNEEDEDYVPCSEPQEDEPSLRTESTNVFLASDVPVIPLGTNGPGFAIADIADLYFTSGVSLVRCGVTYAFQILALSSDVIIAEGVPRIALV